MKSRNLIFTVDTKQENYEHVYTLQQMYGLRVVQHDPPLSNMGEWRLGAWELSNFFILVVCTSGNNMQAGLPDANKVGQL